MLTHPPGVRRREIDQFLMRHSGWLRKALDKAGPVVTIDVGAQIPIDGVLREIVHDPKRRKAPTLSDNSLQLFGRGALGPKALVFLKARARDQLVPAARSYAKELGREVGPVSLRDTRSRWGSCSSTGALSFSWRLVKAPVEVQEYVAAHEAAHLVEMNHSSRFWAVVDRIFPGWEVQREWLKREGRGLHNYRFNSD